MVHSLKFFLVWMYVYTSLYIQNWMIDSRREQMRPSIGNRKESRQLEGVRRRNGRVWTVICTSQTCKHFSSTIHPSFVPMLCEGPHVPKGWCRLCRVWRRCSQQFPFRPFLESRSQIRRTILNVSASSPINTFLYLLPTPFQCNSFKYSGSLNSCAPQSALDII
jgi:hypothetical protein